MQDWDDMKFLLALKRHKTMSAAAVTLHSNVATVSRRIDKLSSEMGMPLFTRAGQQGWDATPAASRLAAIAERFDAELLQESNRMAQEASGETTGNLRISAPPFCTSVFLVPHVSHFIDENRGIELSIRSRTVSEGLGDDDLMVRVGRPDSGRLVARRLAGMKLRMYRSSLAPAAAEGWISAGNQFGRDTRLPEPGPEVGPMRLMVSNFDTQLAAMRSTGLAGLLPDRVAQALADMYPAAGTEEVELEIWLAYHATRRMDPVIELGCNWLVDCFRDTGAAHKQHPVAQDERIEVRQARAG